MYFPRHLDPVLDEWSRTADRKPLVLRGARQTGKSSSVRRFGERFDLFLELNLERYEDLKLVRSSRSAAELLRAVAARHNVARFPERTLLFLDEIQESPDAVGWLRFFREDHPELHVVAAGSLLEVRLQERGFSFPVGRVTFRALRPLGFFEFLAAVGRDVLRDELRRALAEGRPAAEALHQQALELLRDYLWVGGMPEAVKRWVADGNPAAVREVHSDLVQALAEDVQKYRGVRDVEYLEAAFENLPAYYGQRFKYEQFAPGYRSQQMKAALSKLESTFLLTRVWPTSSLRPPFQVRRRSAPKLLPLDVGLATFALTSRFTDIRTSRLDRLLEGRLAEIFVGQQLLTGRQVRPETLHFWVSESSRNNAEVDYVVERAGHLLPIEVKASASGSLKSLHQLLWRAGLSRGVRLHEGPHLDEEHTVKMTDGGLSYRLLSLPLYLAEEVATLPDSDAAFPDELC